jgi:DNA polymerase-3 subunit epsilon
MIKLCHLDTETTGLDPKTNSIFQISGIIEIDNEVKEEFNIFVRPRTAEECDPHALKITNKTVEELMSYPPMEEGYNKLVSIFNKYIDRFDTADKFFMVAFCGHFDVGFLREFFLRNGDKYYGSYFWSNIIDISTLATLATLNERKTMPNFKLISVANQFGVKLEESEAHDSMEDIKATRNIFKCLVGEL